MKLRAHPTASSLFAGFVWTLGWTAIWWLALDTPLKPILVRIGQLGFGKHGYLLGLIPVLLTGIVFIAGRKRRLGIALIVGAISGCLACIGALIIFLIGQPNLPPISIW